MSDFTTWASAAVIIIVFLLFCKEEYKLYNIKEAIKKLLNNDNILDSLKETKIAPLAETYSKTINIETHEARNLTFLPLSILMTIACVNITNLTYECSTLQQELSLV
jgi:hypothetical protein